MFELVPVTGRPIDLASPVATVWLESLTPILEVSAVRSGEMALPAFKTSVSPLARMR
jgi:hypothetical protein